MIYRGFDQSELDLQYSPSSRVADIGYYLDEYALRSRAARDTLPVRTFYYGPSAAERIDFFPATRHGAPLHVFLHGGYWQELSVEESAFAAAAMVRAGCAFAAVGYGLAPAHNLDAIVAMARRGLHWLSRHAGALGVAENALHVSGHSAGAHLVAMAVLTGPWPDGRASADVVASATLLSGIYDLEPIRLSYVNEPLRLDAAAALRNSPIHQLRGCPPPVLVARGGQETAEFGRQHDEFVAALRDHEFEVDDLVVGHRNHFDLPFDLAAPDTVLGRAVLATMLADTRDAA
jgi:arylformamidase